MPPTILVPEQKSFLFFFPKKRYLAKGKYGKVRYIERQHSHGSKEKKQLQQCPILECMIELVLLSTFKTEMLGLSMTLITQGTQKRGKNIILSLV